MRLHRRWIALTVGVVLVAFGVVLAVQHRTRAVGPAPRAGAQARRRASTLTTLDGKPISSAALKGKTYVVNFCNSWCIPCQQEAARAPDVLRRAQERSPTSRWSASSATTMPRRSAHYVGARQHHVAGRRSIRTAAPALGFGTTGQPETYVISPDGVAGVRHARPVDRRRPRDAGSARARAGGVCRVEARSWVPWLALAVVVVIAVVVLVVRSRPEQLARGRARRASRTSSRARCARASRSPTATRRESRAIRDDIASASARGQSDARSATLRRDLRRAHPAHAVERRARRDRVGRADRSRSCSAPSGIRSRSRGGAERRGCRARRGRRSSSSGNAIVATRDDDAAQRGARDELDRQGARSRARLPAALARRSRDERAAGNIDDEHATGSCTTTTPRGRPR